MAANQFYDAKGRTWNLEFTVGDRDLLKAAVDFDLYTLLDNEAKELLALFDHDGRFAEVLWAAIAEQGAEQGVDQKAFCKGLTGAVLTSAKYAFEQAAIDFFQSNPERANALRKILASRRELARKGMEAMDKRMAAATEEASVLLVKKIESIPLNDLLGKSADA